MCSKTKQSNAEQNKNDEKYSQTGIIVKIHTNHDGVSNCDHVEIHHSYLIIAISSHHSKDSLRNYISLCSSEQRACFDILSNVLSGKSHQSKKASFECCHHKQPSCSHEFSCRLFTKHKPWTVCFVTWKLLLVFMSHNSAGFYWILHFQILY